MDSTTFSADSAASHPKYRRDIDGLRALAILLVLGFHAFPDWIPSGFVGVDIFFVISGFLISTILMGQAQRGAVSFSGFYSRRIKRIFPALITVMAASLLFGYRVLLADEYQQLGKHILSGAVFIQNFTLWQESGYFDNQAETKPMLHLWSLAIEEQFYIVWPLVIAGLWKWRRGFLAAMLGLMLISFAANLYWAATDATADFYSPVSRFWELAVGGLLAYGLAHYPATLARYQQAQALLGLVFLVAAVLLIDKHSRFPGGWALLPTLGSFLLLSAGPGAWLNRYVLSNRLMVGIGLISYPLYLWHWPLLTFPRIILGQPLEGHWRVLLLLLAFVLAYLTYRFIETPIRFGRKNGYSVWLLLLAMLVCAGYAGQVYRKNGLENRAVEFNTLAQINQFKPTYRENCQSITHVAGDDWCHVSEGNEASKVLLIGDSHANAFSTVLSALRTRTEFSFIQIGRGHCPSLLGFGRPDCLKIADAALLYAQTHPAVKQVLIAAIWPAYYNGFERDGVRNSADEFKQSLQATLMAYQKLGKQITLILTVPTGGKPRTCIQRPMGIDKPVDCNIALSEAQAADGAYRDYFKGLSQVGLIDPWPALCDATHCKILDQDKILYIDDSHLSPFGGEYLAQHLQDQLWSVIPR